MTDTYGCGTSQEYAKGRTLVVLPSWSDEQIPRIVYRVVVTTTTTALVAIHADVGVAAQHTAPTPKDTPLIYEGRIPVPASGEPVIAVYTFEPGRVSVTIDVLDLDLDPVVAEAQIAHHLETR